MLEKNKALGASASTTSATHVPLPVIYCCLARSSIYLTTSPTVCSFSASSSGTSTENSSSNAITNSTMSSESAPKSSMKDACGVTCSGLTPGCSTMMSLTFSSIDFSDIKFVPLVLVAHGDLKAIRAQDGK